MQQMSWLDVSVVFIENENTLFTTTANTIADRITTMMSSLAAIGINVRHQYTITNPSTPPLSMAYEYIRMVMDSYLDTRGKSLLKLNLIDLQSISLLMIRLSVCNTHSIHCIDLVYSKLANILSLQ